MTCTIQEVKQILKTLPITLYANCKLPISIDEEAETSYFCPNTREIYISLKGINTELANMPTEGLNKEQTIRAHLYHELSHAILTPLNLKITDVTNIFEDERIETLLKDYYMDTHFKESIKALCDFKNLSAPVTADQKFFYTVRFRIGKAEWLDKVDNLIQRFATLNWNSNNNTVAVYYSEIYALYWQIAYNDTFDWQEAIEQHQQIGGQADIPETYNGNEQTDKQDEAIKGEGDKERDASTLVSQAISSMGNAETRDEPLYQAVESILQNFSKKNKGGSAMSAYSGVFNPRSVARDDYRYFDRKANVNGVNHFGSVHLNMFIDDSGSFSPNKDAANKIIATLCALERKYSFFTVDFALCGNMVKRVNHKNARINANEGTRIDSNAVQTVLSMQKKDCLTYNIVLYDGSAWFLRDSFKYAYRPFDMTNTTLILDNDCCKDAKSCKKAKVIISQNYVEELRNNIIKTLRKAFQ